MAHGIGISLLVQQWKLARDAHRAPQVVDGGNHGSWKRLFSADRALYQTRLRGVSYRDVGIEGHGILSPVSRT